MNRPRIRTVAVALALVCGGALGCGDDAGLTNPASSPYQPLVVPGHFSASTAVDNPYFPLVSGTELVYEGKGERGVIEVLSERRTVMGIECVVVRDRAYEDGELVEDTYDWFAQDNDGNVWYFGEDSHEVKDGKYVNSHGSWEAGTDGALPGIIMLGKPLAGVWYRQEYYRGEAEDMGQVLALDETVTTPAGTFEHCLQTLDTNALEPKVQEYKWYAPGIGVVKEQEIRGGSDAMELVSVRRP
ncbi:MAG: hypothetical protein WDA75_14580 [Candidatus Latescibacterota bacterium]|jgi:hypothetical protein